MQTLVTFNEMKFKRANQPEQITLRTERLNSQIGSSQQCHRNEFSGVNENYCCGIWMDSQDEAIETNSIPAKHQNSNIKKNKILKNLMPNVITYLLKKCYNSFLSNI